MNEPKRRGPKPGSKRSPDAQRPGPSPLPASQKVVRKNLSLYAWEWAEFQRGSEGPTEAARRILAERRDG